MLEDVEDVAALGVVPVEDRGSWPFALLHGESLVAVASWALTEAGVELLDFTASWADVQARECPLVIHDPLCPATPVPFLVEAVAAAADPAHAAVVVGVGPVTDTVRHADATAALGDPADRDALRVVLSPVVLPAAVVASLADWPVTDDLAALVARLAEHHEVVLLEAPAAARRVVDQSDLELLEALSG